MTAWVVIGVVGVGALLIWIGRRPERGLYAAIFFTGILMTPSLPFVREKFAATEVCMLITWLALLLGHSRSSKRLAGNQPQFMLTLLAFILWAFVAYFAGILAAPRGVVDSTVEMLNYAYGMLITFTVIRLVDRWEVLMGCLQAWILGAAIVSAVGMLAVLGMAPEWAYDDYSHRVSSTLKFENQVPSFLLPILPVAVVLAVARPQALHRRLFFAAVAFAGIGTVAMTGSRAGLIMSVLMVVGLARLAAAEGDRPRIHGSLITSAVMGLAALQVAISVYALATYHGDYHLGTTPPWQRPTVMLYDWITGSGGSLEDIDRSRIGQTTFVLGNFDAYAMLGIGPKMVGVRYGMEEIHNTYLGVLLETGVLGFAVFMGCIAFVLIQGDWAVRRCNGDLERAVVRAMVLGFLVLLFYQLTMYGLRQRNLWIMMGLIIALRRVLPRSGLLRPLRRGPAPAPLRQPGE